MNTYMQDPNNHPLCLCHQSLELWAQDHQPSSSHHLFKRRRWNWTYKTKKDNLILLWFSSDIVATVSGSRYDCKYSPVGKYSRSSVGFCVSGSGGTVVGLGSPVRSAVKKTTCNLYPVSLWWNKCWVHTPITDELLFYTYIFYFTYFELFLLKKGFYV